MTNHVPIISPKKTYRCPVKLCSATPKVSSEKWYAIELPNEQPAESKSRRNGVRFERLGFNPDNRLTKKTPNGPPTARAADTTTLPAIPSPRSTQNRPATNRAGIIQYPTSRKPSNRTKAGKKNMLATPPKASFPTIQSER